MAAIRRTNFLSLDEFILNYEGTRCQYHEGEIWEAQPTSPDHSFIQRSISENIGFLFSKIGGPKRPGGWWIFTEAAVRYENKSLFSHDIAGWKRTLHPERPRRYPISEKPDWVCEILSNNTADDLVKKKVVLYENEVPFYWIVHPAEKLITIFKWSSEGYVSILDVAEGFEGHLPPFESVVLKANVLFGEQDE
jgi:Uma2 family endonuclease